jgi:hypothetical protein
MSYERQKEKGKRPDVTVQSKMEEKKEKKMAPMKKMAVKKTVPKKKM